MPELSASAEEMTVLTWLKADGDVVRAGEDLVELEVDKATMTYAAESDGILRIIAAEGAALPPGAILARLDPVEDGRSPSPGETTDPQPVALPVPAAVPVPAAGSPAGTSNGADQRSVRATPLARRVAREHQIDLAIVAGSGPGGRITRADVAQAAGLTVASGPAPRLARTQPPPAGGERIEEPSGQQRVMARRMSEANAVPDFQLQVDVEVDRLMQLRNDLGRLELEGPVPSVNDFVVRACALSLLGHPRVNGSYRDGRYVLHAQVNVGIAVATDGGLVVATIFDAASLTIREIALQSRALAVRARAGESSPTELSGATFTVSNLGMYGMTAITPIINPPQAAILGVGVVRRATIVREAAPAVGQIMTLTLSCDHRILSGTDGARFLSDVRTALESPLRLLV